MPIYEYQCDKCQHELEVLQKMSADPLVECPECHENTLKKKISAAGFRLSGSGWYETDFKKSGNKKNLVGEPSKSTSQPKEKAEASSKSESKTTKSSTTSD